jgi:biotin operon repressor
VRQRLARVLRLLTLLEASPRRRQELAAILGVSERTITKDLAALADASFTVHRTRAGYTLSRIPRSQERRLAPGYAVSVCGAVVTLVELVPRGTAMWVERAVSPQPPRDLLQASVPPPARRPRRALYPLPPELRIWLEQH